MYGDGGKRNSDCDVCQQTVQILYKRKHDASFNFSDMTQLSKVCVEVPKKNVEKVSESNHLNFNYYKNMIFSVRIS